MKLRPAYRFAITFFSTGIYTFLMLEASRTQTLPSAFLDKIGQFSDLGLVFWMLGYIVIAIILFKTGITSRPSQFLRPKP